MSYKPVSAPDEFMEMSYSVPTVTINRFLVSGHGEMVRIAIGESRTPESQTNFRGAIAISRYQAWELAKIIQQFLGPDYDKFEKDENSVQRAS